MMRNSRRETAASRRPSHGVGRAGRGLSLLWIGIVAASCAVVASPIQGEEPEGAGTATDAPLDTLVEAVHQQDEEAIERLLAGSGAVDAAQPDGMTALHWAVYQDDLALTERLIAAGADVQATNHYGVMPLALACLNGNRAIVARLLEAGADPNARQAGGESVLMTAARTGKPRPVALLLAAGAEVEATERNGQTALMWAAAEGHRAVVEQLLEAGANVHQALPAGFTPLLFAAREGRLETAIALLEAGAKVERAMEPERSRRKGVRRGTSALILAVENGHFELALELVRRGADPNDKRTGFTPLHTLTWVRKPNRGDGEDGDPPPLGSGRVSSLDFARELIRLGADVNATLERGSARPARLNHRGAAPFFFAADTADLPLMRLLCERGADPLRPNVDGTTPLMAAAGAGTRAPGEEAGTEAEALAAVEWLLDRGAAINTVDQQGETAMHGAAYKSLPQMVRLLAERGADVEVWNRENRYGWTPLRIARGYRPGNFKPAPATIEAIEAVMRAAGVTVPELDPSLEPENY